MWLAMGAIRAAIGGRILLPAASIGAAVVALERGNLAPSAKRAAKMPQIMPQKLL